jgi:fermentation-respiration switch protein FrsA (DUF1100 family)
MRPNGSWDLGQATSWKAWHSLDNPLLGAKTEWLITMLAFAWKAAVALIVLYGLVVLATYALQRRLIYFPDTQRIPPALANLPDVEERTLRTPDGAEVLVWYGRAKVGQPTLLYFHGNAGSFQFRQERIRRYMARGVGVYMMTYRGYGGSTGSPSEANNVADGKLAYDSLVADGVKPEDIIVYGESLGSGVAVQVAAARPVGGVILDAPYTSLVDVAETVYPFLPARWLMTDRYETTNYIAEVRAPLLILHGENDEVVPVAMGRAVFAAANEPKTLRVLAGAGHSDHWNFGSYDAAYAWLDDWRARRRRASGRRGESQ